MGKDVGKRGIKREEELMRHIIKNFFESEKKCRDDIEVETELGRADYVCTENYRGNHCVNIVEIKTPREVNGIAKIKEVIKELIIYSEAMHLHDNYKHCRYHRGYIAIDESSLKKGSVKLKDIKGILNRYNFGLIVVDLRSETVKKCIHPKVKAYPKPKM